MVEKKKMDPKTVLRVGAVAVLLLSPLILMCFRSLQTGMNCFKLHAVWSDEMVYWREVYNFIHTGISGGYTGADDRAPRLANFGTHSFLNTILYAAFAMLFGWQDNSIMIYNLLFLILCLAVFIWQVRPGMPKSLLLAGLVICYLPLYYYLPTSMTEVINYGGILLYTAALLGYYRTGKERWFLLTLFWTVFLTFYKLPNAVFFIPLVLSAFTGRVTKRFVLHTAGCVAVCGVVYEINNAFTSPYPWFFSDVFAQDTVGQMIAKVWGRFTENLGHFLSLQYGTVQERMQRYFYLFVMAVLLILSVRQFLSGQKKKEGRQPVFSYFLMLFASFLLVNGFYEVWDWRDYRMMAPVLWAALVMLVLCFPLRYALLPLLSGLFMFGCEIVRPNEVFISWERTVPIETPGISRYIIYDAGADNRFDNTLAVESVNLGIYCRMEPGIGIQNIFTPESITRSKYIWVQDIEYDFPGYRLEAEGDFGRLYVRE